MMIILFVVFLVSNPDSRLCCSFGKRSGGGGRRNNECLILEPSEMLVVSTWSVSPPWIHLSRTRPLITLVALIAHSPLTHHSLTTPWHHLCTCVLVCAVNTLTTHSLTHSCLTHSHPTHDWIVLFMQEIIIRIRTLFYVKLRIRNYFERTCFSSS